MIISQRGTSIFTKLPVPSFLKNNVRPIPKITVQLKRMKDCDKINNQAGKERLTSVALFALRQKFLFRLTNPHKLFFYRDTIKG
ncbi:MAG: hypothetical protein OCC45_08790 [Desulfotalea sp.]